MDPFPPKKKSPPGDASPRRKPPTPSKYRPEYCAALIEFMATGASLTSFAATIGVNPNTVRAWAAAHPEFAEAKDLAFAKCQQWWETKIREGLFDVTESSGTGKDRTQRTSRLNANAARLVMMNLFNWTDRQVQEAFNRPAGPEAHGIKPYEEWAEDDLRQLQRLLDKYKLPGQDAVAPDDPDYLN
jgi:hypothetical protein